MAENTRKRSYVILSSESESENDDIEIVFAGKRTHKRPNRDPDYDENTRPKKKFEKKSLPKRSQKPKSDESDKEDSILSATSDSDSDFELEVKKGSKKKSKTGSDLDDDDFKTNRNKILIEELDENDTNQVVNFLNNCSVDEFLSVASLNENRLKLLFSLRPFKDIDDLRTRLNEKLFTTTLESIEKTVYARKICTKLFDECLKISQNIEKKVSLLLNDDKKSQLEIKHQPKILNKS